MSILKTITVGGMLEQQARDYPDNDAVVYVDRGLRLSYKEFDRKCDDCAKALIAMGVSVCAQRFPVLSVYSCRHTL